MKDTKMRYMCLTGSLDTDLASTLMSKSSNLWLASWSGRWGKSAKKVLRKESGRDWGEKVASDILGYNYLQSKHSETWDCHVKWFVYPTWMLVNGSFWESTHQSSINSWTASEAKQMQAQRRVEIRPECDHFTHPCCFSISLCKWLTLINSNSPDRDWVHKLWNQTSLHCQHALGFPEICPFTHFIRPLDLANLHEF